MEAARGRTRRACVPSTIHPDWADEVSRRHPARGRGDEDGRGGARDQNRSDKGTEARTLQAASFYGVRRCARYAWYARFEEQTVAGQHCLMEAGCDGGRVFRPGRLNEVGQRQRIPRTRRYPAYEAYLAYRESPDDEIDDLAVRRSQRRSHRRPAQLFEKGHLTPELVAFVDDRGDSGPMAAGWKRHSARYGQA